MRNRLNNRIGQWLAAERSATVEQAEQSLRELFGLLVDPMPSAGFAERVMLAMATVPHSARLARGWRLTLAASLVVAALSVAFAPLVLLIVAETVRVGPVIELVGSGVVLASGALVDWLSFWQSVVGLNRVVMTIISTPPVAATLLAVAVLTTVSFRVFAGLMVADRSAHNA